MANGIGVESSGQQAYPRRRAADKGRGPRSPTVFGGAVSIGSRTQRSPKRGSPTILGHYAGAKFSEPPEAAALPKPPAQWTLDSATHHLKLLLNVQA